MFRFSRKRRRRSRSKLVMERTYKEKEAIIGFHLKSPLEVYRRLTFMMLDADIVAVSPPLRRSKCKVRPTRVQKRSDEIKKKPEHSRISIDRKRPADIDEHLAGG
jgi:hypothetical protein